jgi:N-acyl-phosphatidylethanolamine-hydrolysing phospholipase D
VQIFQDIGCKRALSVHWGTFQLTDEALDEPPRALARALRVAGLAPERFFTLPVGGTCQVPVRQGAVA